MSVPPPGGSRDYPASAQAAAPRRPLLGLSRFTWLAIAIAFAVGLLLFLMLWLDQRNDNDFYRMKGAAQPTSDGQAFEPLPAPLPADNDPASGMQDRDERVQAPQAEEPPAMSAPMPVEQPPPLATTPDTQTAGGGSTPEPISSPAPRYPPAALRRGESGTVLLRVHVGVDGVPYAVDLVESSRSRLLDRAATEAVKRWRFRPAQRDGQPIQGQVQVPISFNAGG
jgi:periplasmic protein TonB